MNDIRDIRVSRVIRVMNDIRDIRVSRVIRVIRDTKHLGSLGSLGL